MKFKSLLIGSFIGLFSTSVLAATCVSKVVYMEKDFKTKSSNQKDSDHCVQYSLQYAIDTLPTLKVELKKQGQTYDQNEFLLKVKLVGGGKLWGDFNMSYGDGHLKEILESITLKINTPPPPAKDYDAEENESKLPKVDPDVKWGN